MLQKISFEVPERIIDTLAQNMSNKMSSEIKKDEDSEELDKEKVTSIESSIFKKTAESLIRRKWIFDEIAEHENIDVSEEEIESAVRSIALSKNKDPQKYMLQLKAVNRLDDIIENIRENKIYEFLIEKASEKRKLIV